MLPFLEIAGFKIPMYSLMIAIGVFFGGLYFFLVTFKEEHFSKLTLKRFFFAIVLSAICLVIGAALFDSLFHSIEEGTLVIGGITWLGGVVIGFPSLVLLAHLLIPEAKGKSLKFVSLIIPSIVLAHAFGRIGCFFGGCCYGKVTDSIFGVKFPFLEEKVLPTQLFETIFDFILFSVMAVLRKKIKYHNFEIYFIAYGVFRFFNEFLRGDDRGATYSVLSPAQLLSICIIIAGIIIINRYFLSTKISKQLSINRRANNVFLFKSKTDYKLELSWRNGAIILTSLVLVLFLTSCGKTSCACAQTCEQCFQNFTCLGCACKCMADDGAAAAAHYNETETTTEAAQRCCSLCQTHFCEDACDCKGFIQACKESSDDGCGSDDYVALFFTTIKNTLSALLSFGKEIVYYK